MIEKVRAMLSKKRTSSARIGVRGCLFLAFTVIVALAVATAGLGVASFMQLGHTVEDITTSRLPPITAALQLARATEKIVALGPALAGAASPDELQARAGQLAEQNDRVQELLSRIGKMDVDRSEFETVRAAIADLNDLFAALKKNVAERLASRDAAKKQLEGVIKSDAEIQKFFGLLTSVANSELSEAQLAITTYNSNPAAHKEAADRLVTAQEGITSLREMQEQFRTVNSAIVEGSVSSEPKRLELLGMQVDLPMNDIKDRIGKLDSRQGDFLNKQLVAIDAAIAKDTGIFAMRTKELSLAKAAQESIEKARDVTEQLSAAVDKLVKTQQSGAEGAAAASHALIAGRVVLLVSVAFAIVVSAILIAWLYVGRRVVGRVKALEAAMRRIADGDLETPIPAATGDEIGAMAKALVVFRDNAVKIEEANARALREQAEASEARRRERLKIADEFESQVRGVVEAVSSSSTQLQSNAHVMVTTVDDASRQAASVAAVSEQTTANVGTVATAAEQLSSSIAEIARQVAESTRIAGQAVAEAERTNGTVKSLAEAAQKIGDVVKLINEIASQTNLLALNATIEAARAGEAGKGFAVVASEVKNLASETAKATEEIAAQVGAIQTTTESSVTAIGTISSTIARINEIANSIAAAVEEQGAATQEIARNVQEAARGTQDVSANIAGVASAANQTGSAAGQVLSAAEMLSQQAEKLRGSVDQFLGQIRVG